MARSDDDLRALLADLESDQVERKQSASDTGRIAEAICAFANDLPGYRSSGMVFVGATDDGHPSGLSIDDELLLTLANIRDTGKILPLQSMRVVRLDRPALYEISLEFLPASVAAIVPGPVPPLRS
ncbi:MAG: ATP-binding protein [Actinomycetota bacterium]|nr:ATP-binding protein [Actinomycetota bacterium]